MLSLAIRPQGTLSKQCLEYGLLNYLELLTHIKNLPYGRLEQRGDYLLTLEIACGTCSSKHAFLKQVAIEQEWDQILLLLVLYKMNGVNTPGISEVLNRNKLEYIPEAHCVLYDRDSKEFLDNTFSTSDFSHLIQDTLLTEVINPEQILHYKIQWHQNHLENWCKTQGYSLEYVWSAREECITSIG